MKNKSNKKNISYFMNFAELMFVMLQQHRFLLIK